MLFIISEQTGCEEAYIQSVLECCFSLGLFDKKIHDESGIITSNGIQERYAKICSLTKKRVGIDEYNLLSGADEIASEAKGITSEVKGITSEVKGITSEVMPQRKEKEIKEKEREKRKISPPQFLGEEKNFLEEKKIGGEKIFSVDALLAETLGNTPWLDAVFVQLRQKFTAAGLGRSAVDGFLREFAGEQRLKGEDAKSRRDFMAHFVSWLKIALGRSAGKPAGAGNLNGSFNNQTVNDLWNQQKA